MQTNTIPVSQANTSVNLLERTALKIATISHFLAADEDASVSAKQGAIEILEEIRNTIFEACGHCEIVRDYLTERAEPLEISRTAMLKGWIDKADEELANQLILFITEKRCLRGTSI